MFAPYWLFILGSLFVLVTRFLPKGVVGTFGGLRARRAPATAAAVPAATAGSPAE